MVTTTYRRKRTVAALYPFLVSYLVVLLLLVIQMFYMLQGVVSSWYVSLPQPPWYPSLSIYFTFAFVFLALLPFAIAFVMTADRTRYMLARILALTTLLLGIIWSTVFYFAESVAGGFAVLMVWALSALAFFGLTLLLFIYTYTTSQRSYRTLFSIVIIGLYTAWVLYLLALNGHMTFTDNQNQVIDIPTTPAES
jgi:tryptophan-rich sensory protein